MLALLPTDWIVADLACGTGQATAELARCVKQVIAVDNSAAMLKAARRRTADFSNVDLRRGDLEALPIDDGQCDAVLVLLALTYVQTPEIVVREMRRILKPGGRAVIVDVQTHDREDFRVEMGQARRGLEPSELETMMAAAGFAAIVSRPLPAEANVKGPGLFLSVASRSMTRG
jgi:ArsR family transcriptional regulator